MFYIFFISGVKKEEKKVGLQLQEQIIGRYF